MTTRSHPTLQPLSRGWAAIKAFPWHGVLQAPASHVPKESLCVAQSFLGRSGTEHGCQQHFVVTPAGADGWPEWQGPRAGLGAKASVSKHCGVS